MKIFKSDKLLSQISEYQQNVASGKEKKSEKMEIFIKEISPFIGKKGKPLKRKLRSKKQINKFNELVGSFHKSNFSTQRKRKSEYNKKIKSLYKSQRIEDIAGKKVSNTDSKRILNAFIDLSSDYMRSNFAPSSDDIVDLALYDKKITSDTLKDIANYVMDDLQNRTPSFLQEYLQTDDTYNYAIKIMDLMKEKKTYDIDDLVNSVRKDIEKEKKKKRGK